MVNHPRSARTGLLIALIPNLLAAPRSSAKAYVCPRSLGDLAVTIALNEDETHAIVRPPRKR
jgi:hypothetical protein